MYNITPYTSAMLCTLPSNYPLYKQHNRKEPRQNKLLNVLRFHFLCKFPNTIQKYLKEYMDFCFVWCILSNLYTSQIKTRVQKAEEIKKVCRCHHEGEGHLLVEQYNNLKHACIWMKHIINQHIWPILSFHKQTLNTTTAGVSHCFNLLSSKQKSHIKNTYYPL